MTTKGIIIKTMENSARVAVVRQSACGGSCDSCQSCETENIFVDVANDIHAKVGDVVEVEEIGGNVIRFSFILYTIPLLFFVFSVTTSYILLARYVKDIELVSFLIGVASLGLVYVILKRFDKKYQKKEFIKVTKIIGGLK